MRAGRSRRHPSFESSPGQRVATAIVVAATVLSTGLWACARDESGTIDATATIVVDSSSEAASSPGTQPVVDTNDPFAVFGLAHQNVATTPTTMPVWLVNRSAGQLIMLAEAGAGTVVLDTVGAADSVLVRIETMADSVTLSARSPGGSSAGRLVVATDTMPARAAFPH